jgi:hypothetical protein
VNKRGMIYILGKIERRTEGERARQLEWLESETIQSATFQSRTQHAAVESSSQFSPMLTSQLKDRGREAEKKGQER